MQAAVTVAMDAPAREVWDVVADVRNTGKFSPRPSRRNGSTGQRALPSARSSVGTSSATRLGPSTGRRAA